MPVFRTPQLVLFSANVPRAVEFYSALGFTEAFRVPAEGERQLIAWTADPDGNTIQIVQHL